jgi:hypothetical protein
MTEYASRGHESSHAPPASSSASSGYTPTSRTAAEKAADAVTSFTREVGAIAGALEALAQARDANDLTRWHEARVTVDRFVAAADVGQEKASARAGDAASDATTHLATARQTLVQSKAAARELIDHPPAGYKPVARETELLAVVTHQPSGSTKAGMEAKEHAIRAELTLLSPAKCRALATRLDKRVPEDKVAAAFASAANLGTDRRARLVAFLGDARRREALASAKPARPSPALERPGTPPLVASFEQAVATVAAGAAPEVSRAPATTPASPQHEGALKYLRIYGGDAWRGIAAHLAMVVWPPPADRLAFPNELVSKRPSQTSKALARVWAGPPVLAFQFAEIDRPAFQPRAYAALKPHLDIMAVCVAGRRVGVHSSVHWQADQRPKRGHLFLGHAPVSLRTAFVEMIPHLLRVQAELNHKLGGRDLSGEVEALLTRARELYAQP